jgi:hypothetical protein
MILVKMAPGLVIEFGPGEQGKWDCLSLRLPQGVAAQPVRFEVCEGPAGRLLVRPLEAVDAASLVTALGAVLANEVAILAEVRKYAGAPAAKS